MTLDGHSFAPQLRGEKGQPARMDLRRAQHRARMVCPRARLEADPQRRVVRHERRALCRKARRPGRPGEAAPPPAGGCKPRSTSSTRPQASSSRRTGNHPRRRRRSRRPSEARRTCLQMNLRLIFLLTLPCFGAGVTGHCAESEHAADFRATLSAQHRSSPASPSGTTLRATLAPGSDIWPLTWAADGHQYTTFGDGGGFGGTDQRSAA